MASSKSLQHAALEFHDQINRISVQFKSGQITEQQAEQAGMEAWNAWLAALAADETSIEGMAVQQQ